MSNGIPVDAKNANDVPQMMRDLSEPFPPGAVGWKPQSVKGNRAIALAYIDARDVMDRLDKVFGPDGWEDKYEVLEEGSVRCILRLRFGSHWVEKSDVGSQSEQPDGGDRMKAAFSDALKRTAVKLGIGRYLYYLDTSWSDYDPAKKRLTPPSLPTWALPGGSGRPTTYGPPPYAAHLAPDDPHAKQPAPAPAATNGKAASLTMPQIVQAIKTKQPPVDGVDLQQRVGWLATQLPRLVKGFDPADLDAAIGDTLGLGESWRYDAMTAEHARHAWRVVADYVAGMNQPVKV